MVVAVEEKEEVGCFKIRLKIKIPLLNKLLSSFYIQGPGD